MIKKIILMFVIASFVLVTACKKETASSKIDANATEIAPADPNAANPEANINGPEMPAEKVTPPVDGKYPEMTFDTNEHDFGLIKQGDKVVYSFKFKNTGEADLKITSARGTCGCTVPDYPKEPVKPGESGKIKVSFNSAGKHGQTSKSVIITCNTKDGKEELKIKANIEVPEGSKK